LCQKIGDCTEQFKQKSQQKMNNLY
jgi:hypothetical protein